MKIISCLIWLNRGWKMKIRKKSQQVLSLLPLRFQRLEAGAKGVIQLTKTPTINKLPQDRESLFYFNLREIPPKSEEANALQIALQTKLKLFYRPESVIAKPNAVWQDQLILHKTSQGYRIENPTPYYITVIGLGDSEKSSRSNPFKVVMIAPKSFEDIKTAEKHPTVYLTYINDYGGRPALAFHCDSNKCIADKYSSKK
ncbi:fimbria/pilus periplasmic chaperone [Vibrio metschnikovii]